MKLIKYQHEALKWLHDEDGYGKDFIMVRSEKVICPSCHGEGSTFRSDLDESRMYDMMIEDEDYEGIEEMRRGAFNQTCKRCNGKNVVDDVDWDDAERRFPKEVEAIRDWVRAEAADARYAAQERAYCSGGRY